MNITINTTYNIISTKRHNAINSHSSRRVRSMRVLLYISCSNPVIIGVQTTTAVVNSCLRSLSVLYSHDNAALQKSSY